VHQKIYLNVESVSSSTFVRWFFFGLKRDDQNIYSFLNEEMVLEISSRRQVDEEQTNDESQIFEHFRNY
jgi:hypothetical protein